MVKRKLNIKRLGVFFSVILVLLLLIIFGISSLVSESKLRKTDEYKLSEVGYTDNEIKIILKELKGKELDNIINSKYKKNLTKFLKEKYFIYDNLEKYLSYYSDNESVNVREVISIVNTKADTEWYSNIKETDTSKENLMLVNKFYGLKEDYVPSDLVLVSSTYAYEGNYVSESIYDNLVRLLNAAKDKGYVMVVSQGYRSYSDQQEAYKDYENASDTEEADRLAARPGHSDYQTGLAVSLGVYNLKDEASLEESNKWLMDNCFKYGFIIRYPSGTEQITGFEEDKWRLRYVGVDVSSKIHSEGITFDEYYEYYLNR